MAIIQIEHVSKTFQTKDGTIDALFKGCITEY